MAPRLAASTAAAFLAGLPVLLAFFTWHWFVILPIWKVLLEGIVGVSLAAAGVGWAWRESRRAGRFARPWGGLAFGGVFAGGVVVGELLGLIRGPMPDPTTGSEIARELAFAILPLVAVALAGVHLAGGWRGAAAYAAAGLILLVYLGGSIVVRGGAGIGLGLFALLVPSYLLAGVLVGVIEPRLTALRTKA